MIFLDYLSLGCSASSDDEAVAYFDKVFRDSGIEKFSCDEIVARYGCG